MTRLCLFVGRLATRAPVLTFAAMLIGWIVTVAVLTAGLHWIFPR